MAPIASPPLTRRGGGAVQIKASGAMELRETCQTIAEALAGLDL